MRKIAFYLAVVLLFGLAAMAQDSSNSGSSDMSGMKMGDKSADKASTSKSAGKVKTQHQVTGCLSGPNGEGAYTLTNGRYKKGLEVGGNDELKGHVGHTVTLTGTWAKGEEMGENEKAEPKGEKVKEAVGMHKHFKVTDIKMVSESCTAAPAAAKGAKKSKKAATAATT